MNRYFWTGITHEGRTQAFSELTDFADQYATILNFQRFSDIMLTMILETEERKLPEMLKKFRTMSDIECDREDFQESDALCNVFLNMTFTEGTGNLRIEIPDIPE